MFQPWLRPRSIVLTETIEDSVGAVVVTTISTYQLDIILEGGEALVLEVVDLLRHRAQVHWLVDYFRVHWRFLNFFMTLSEKL